MADPFAWLASYPKSGSTWTRIFLGCYLNDGPVDINSLPYDVCHYDLKPYFYRSLAPSELWLMSFYEVTNLRPAALQHMYCMGSWPLLIKTHHSRARLYGVDLIPNAWTDRAIYLVRDPRDVAVSFANHTSQSIDRTVEMMNDRGAGSSHYREQSLFHFLSDWSTHVNSWMSADQFPVLCLRYEDLLTDPHEQFGKMLEFLEWEVDPDRLDRALEFSSFGNLKSQEDQVGFKELQDRTFFRNGKSGDWVNHLTVENVADIERQHGEVMEKLGYALRSE